MTTLLWTIITLCLLTVNSQISQALSCQQKCIDTRNNFSAFQSDQQFLNKLYRRCLALCTPVSNRNLFDSNDVIGVRIPFLTTPGPATTPTPIPVCGAIKPVTSRIVGGSEAQECQYPWMVSLAFTVPDLRDRRCGATILDERHILTAAHCLISRDSSKVLTASDVQVQAGSSYLSSQRTYRVKHLQLHTQYKSPDTNFDVAVITLASKLTFGPCVSPVCLPNEGDEAQDVGTVMGWGSTEPPKPFEMRSLNQPVLLKVDVPIVSNSKCSTSYPYINQLKLCAGDYENGGIDSCVGDSGGPLVFKEGTGTDAHYVQHGIVSYGHGCSRAKNPGVYTRVSNRQILSFIQHALTNV